MSIADRVVLRYAATKAGPLLPEFQNALNKYRSGEDSQPIQAFIQKVLDIVLPEGKAPTWFMGLGTAKRNTIKFLNSEGRRLLQALGPDQVVHDPDKWRAYMVNQIEKWGKKLRMLELVVEAVSEDLALNVGGFRVIPMPGLPKARVEEAVEALEAATSKVRSVFPKVIYGEVYITTHLEKGKAAWYVKSLDRLYVDMNAKKRRGPVHTILHELGHRFQDRFLSKNLKARFWELSRAGMNVTSYGARDPSENFSDAFAMYVMGESVPPELKAVLDAAK